MRAAGVTRQDVTSTVWGSRPPGAAVLIDRFLLPFRLWPGRLTLDDRIDSFLPAESKLSQDASDDGARASHPA